MFRVFLKWVKDDQTGCKMIRLDKDVKIRVGKKRSDWVNDDQDGWKMFRMGERWLGWVKDC